MPVLAYCLTEARGLSAPRHGVADSGVEFVEQDALKCFFSRTGSIDSILGLPTKRAALAFHDVIQAIFAQAAVIPFRFPTILENEAELLGYMSRQKDVFCEALERLRDMVQMDIRLSRTSTGDGQFLANRDSSSQITGAQYLEARRMQQRDLANSVVPFRGLGNDVICDWRERTSAQGLHCFALIERTAVDAFKTQAATLHLASDVVARVSGPWPASEFVEKS
jgi:Gas vesicle synthesis protein GvpL/GvpF